MKKKPTPEHLALLRAEEIARLKGLQRMLAPGQFESQADQQRVADVLKRVEEKLLQLERIADRKQA